MTQRTSFLRCKIRPEWLKLIGGLILASSFLTQYYLYDRWNSQLADLRSTITDRAIVDKGVLLNQLMYFVLPPSGNITPAVTSEEIRRQHIQEAARKGLLGLTIAVASRGTISTQDTQTLTNLSRAVNGVHDYETFLTFVQLFNDANNAIDLGPQLRALEAKKNLWQWVFLGLFTFGAAAYYIGDFLAAKRPSERWDALPLLKTVNFMSRPEKIITENIIKTILLFGALWLCYLYFGLDEFAVKIGAWRQSVLTVTGLLLAGAVAGAFRFEYEKTSLESTGHRILGHVLTFFLMLGIGLLLLISLWTLPAIATKGEGPLPSDVVRSIRITAAFIYAAVILYDWWDLLRALPRYMNGEDKV